MLGAHAPKYSVKKPEILIAILTDIVLGSPKCYPFVLQLCSVLINMLSTTAEREDVVRDIYEKFQLIPNIGELQIWMQRITYNWAKPITYSEPICKIVANETFIFHLNLPYLMASDYMDYMEEGLTPPEGNEAWIASFARDAFDRVIKPHKAIANYFLYTCYLRIQRHS